MSKLIIVLLGFCSLIVFADSDGNNLFKSWYGGKKTGVSVVKFQPYNEVCGSCHFAYQPGLLPSVSWEKLMSDTNMHFGKDLKLSAVALRTMTRYLLDNSAGRVNDEISDNILKTLKYDPVVIQVTATPYFIDRHKHLDEKSREDLVQCDHCHQGAAQGKFL
jgi:hypothetical protein